MKKLLLVLLFVPLISFGQNDFESSHLYKLNSENLEKLKGTWVGVQRVEKIPIIYESDNQGFRYKKTIEILKKQEFVQIIPDKFDYNRQSYAKRSLMSTFALRVGDFNISEYDSKFDESLDGSADFSFNFSFPSYISPHIGYEYGPVMSDYGYFMYKISSEHPNDLNISMNWNYNATAYKDRIYWKSDGDYDRWPILDNEYRLDVNFCKDCIEYDYSDEERARFDGSNEFLYYKFIDENTIEINFSDYIQDKIVFKKPYIGESLKNIKLVRVSKDNSFEIFWNSYDTDIPKTDGSNITIYKTDGNYVINKPILNIPVEN